MSEKANRRKWSAQEKLRIVLEGSQSNVEVSDLCRREGICPTQYYAWKKQLLSSAEAVFDSHGARPNAKQERLRSELTRMRAVIA